MSLENEINQARDAGELAPDEIYITTSKAQIDKLAEALGMRCDKCAYGVKNGFLWCSKMSCNTRWYVTRDGHYCKDWEPKK